MPARRPEEIHQMFGKLFSAGDLDGLMTLYEKNATLIPQPGQSASGHAAIRKSLSDFLGMKAKFEMRFEQAIQADDIAILYASWTLAGKGPDGSPIKMAGRSSDVVRRQKDGTWLLVIDNPYGGGA